MMESVNEPNGNVLQTKPHFEILDGLRGVAAIAVVVFHFMEFVVPDYNKSFIAHAYLAVDFFFCLSGFVIAYAYDGKMKQLGIKKFVELRLIRLHPLVLIGSVIGLILFVFDPFSNLFAVYGWGKTGLMFIASCLLVPYPLVHERYFNLFHLNPPTWSLFWEYVANIAYALVLYKLRNNILWILTVAAAILLCYEAKLSGQLSVGWGEDNISGGGIRVFYSFLAGMLVYRSRFIIPSKLSFYVLAGLLLVAFLTPYRDATNFFADPLFVILYFPFLVALGAGAKVSFGSYKVCRFLGDISYPLYMVHYPFLWLFFSYLEVKKPPMSELIIMVPVFTLLLIGFAWLVMSYVDVPLRKYLKQKL